MNTDSNYRSGISRILVCGLLLLVLSNWSGCSDKNNPVTPAPTPNPANDLTCQITSANPGSGIAPLRVAFAATASGGTAPYTYSWQFGDGGSSNSASTNHTFQSSGTFAVRLIVEDSHGDRDTGQVSISVSKSSQLACTATASISSGSAPLAVIFAGNASGGTAPYTFAWEFGDGATSSLQNSSHTYTSLGTFAVRLTVEDALGATATKTLTIVVTGTGFTCSATVNQNTGLAPLTLSFSGNASGGQPPYTYSWVFGDGSTSTQQNPNHTYSNPGAYTAQLTVRDAAGTSATKSLQITVSGPSLACTATANPSSGRAPLLVNFSGNASGGQPPYTYNWVFGDGATSTQQNPSHTYTTAGSYTVSFTVRDAAATQCSKNMTVTVVNQLAGPKLSGPGSSTGSISLTWGFTWPVLAATGEGFSVEQSTVSSGSGFSEIAQIPRGSAMQLLVSRTPGTYYFRVRAYVNQGVAPGWTAYSNVVAVTVSSPVSRTRFVNNSSYIVVSLIIDNVQHFVQSPQGILPGHYYEIDLSPGTHTYRMVNGFWDGSSRFEMYTLQGTISQQSGQTGIINFNNPTIYQVLTQFKSSGYWEGTFWQNIQPHTAAFRFYTNGTWRLYVDGVQQSTGSYSIVSRSPGSFSLTFSIGGYSGTLYETLGKFTMRNGPSDWPLIEYFYVGQ